MLEYQLDLKQGSTWNIYPVNTAAEGLPCSVSESGCFLTGREHFTVRSEKPCYQLIYTICGAGRIDYQGTVYALTPASLMLIDCRLMHDFRSAPGQEWSYRFLHFDGEGISFYMRQILSRGGYLKSEDTKIIDRSFTEVDRLAEEDSLCVIARRSLMTVTILQAMLEQMVQGGGNTTAIRNDIHAVQQYIAAHLSDDLSLERLLSVVHLSKYHFIRVFRDQLGMSPGKYIQRCRIDAAKRLLVTTDMPVCEIAASVGYSDPNSFYRAFREQENCSPQLLRRQFFNLEESGSKH